MTRRMPRQTAWMPVLVGGLFVAAGLIGNPWTLASVLSPDGELAGRTRLLILGGDGALALAGMVLIVFRRRLMQGASRGIFARHPNVAAMILGIGASAALVAAVEGTFFVLNRYSGRPADIFRQGHAGDYANLVRTLSPGMRAYDDLLGHRPRANSVFTERLTKGDAVIYDVSYTIDAHRCRVVPQEFDAPPDKFIAFAGCSFAFGTGVADDESLPARVAARTRGHRVYNLANPGDGPHQTLAILGEWDLRFIQEARGELVYVFIPQHISRAAGTMLQTATYGRNDPAFRLEGDSVVYLGSFASAFPARTFFYDLLYHEQALHWLGRDWPPASTKEHIRYSARLLSDASRRFGEMFEDGRFHVLLHPLNEPSGVDMKLVRSIFESEGLHVLDYQSMFDGANEGMFFPVDQHPTPAAHDRVAERLAGDLALATAIK